MQTIIARTVKDLIEVLHTLDPTAGWYGYDDGCIILTKDTQELSAICPNNFKESI